MEPQDSSESWGFCRLWTRRSVEDGRTERVAAPGRRWRLMPKYKLEYLWLDGYEPVPNIRGKTKVVEFDEFPDARRAPALGLRRQLDPPGRRERLGLHAAPRRALPGPRPGERRPRDVRGHAPGRDAASVEQPRDDPGRSRDMVRLRAGVLPLQGRGAARLPGGRRLPAPAGRVLHRRRLPERRRRGPRDRRRASRPLPRGRHLAHGHQRRGGEGPVGVPDLRQGLEAGRRRAVGRALPAPAALRALRRRRQLPSQAPRGRGRLERLGPPHQLLDRVHAGGRRRRRTSRR